MMPKMLMTAFLSAGLSICAFAAQPRSEAEPGFMLLKRNCPDPWLCREGGRFYLTQTGYSSVSVIGADDLFGLTQTDCTKCVIYDATKDPTLRRLGFKGVKGVWSPELHKFTDEDFPGHGGWYLFVALVDAGRPDFGGLASVVLKSRDGRPDGPYGHPVTGEANASALILRDDGSEQLDWGGGRSILRIHDGPFRGIYCCWVTERNRGERNFHQVLEISKMALPWRQTGKVASICRPTQPWEMVGSGRTGAKEKSRRYRPQVVEGVTALYGDRPNEIYLMYSGSGYWTFYGLGQLTWTGEDPLVASSWRKYANNPVFSVADARLRHLPNVMKQGVGHASYFKDAAGQRFLVYHAYPYNPTDRETVVDGELLKPQTKGRHRHAYVEPYRIDHTAWNGVGWGVVTIGDGSGAPAR